MRETPIVHQGLLIKLSYLSALTKRKEGNKQDSREVEEEILRAHGGGFPIISGDARVLAIRQRCH